MNIVRNFASGEQVGGVDMSRACAEVSFVVRVVELTRVIRCSTVLSLLSFCCAHLGPVMGLFGSDLNGIGQPVRRGDYTTCVGILKLPRCSLQRRCIKGLCPITPWTIVCECLSPVRWYDGQWANELKGGCPQWLFDRFTPWNLALFPHRGYWKHVSPWVFAKDHNTGEFAHIWPARVIKELLVLIIGVATLTFAHLAKVFVQLEALRDRTIVWSWVCMVIYHNIIFDLVSLCSRCVGSTAW